MPLEELASTIFIEVLGMTQYPGAPFTGNVIRDIIMFLFIPSVFIILFIYSILGRLFSGAAGTQQKLRLLVGIAIYLFIVTGGYYSTFAYFAGPYFVFLIFILGLIYFIPGHFGFRHEATGHYPESVGRKHAKGMTPTKQIANLEQEIKDTELELSEVRKHGSRDEAAILQRELREMRDELYYLKHPWEKHKAA